MENFIRIQRVLAAILIWVFALILSGCDAYLQKQQNNIRSHFVSVADVEPGIQKDIRYYSSNNFIGRPIIGYQQPLCLLTREAANALVIAQRLAKAQSYSLKVYDCYRPQRAVQDFVEWAKNLESTSMQHLFYPAVPKQKLFELGYIANKSGHSRGSTLDLTLVPEGTRQLPITPNPEQYDCRSPYAKRFPDNSIDMGTGYDCFDELAHTDNPTISQTARYNRDLLRSIMEQAGFVNYDKEWWHYTLRNEPYPESYFDFPVNQE